MNPGKRNSLPPHLRFAILRAMKLRAAAAALLMFCATAAADELRLKDGSKVIGTVVGFEDGAFKVETTYGFALVKKEKVATIIFSDAKPEAKESAKAKKPDPPPPATASAPPTSSPAANTTAPAPQQTAPAPQNATAAPPPATPPQRPPAKAAEPMRESVEGNAYINHTFGFRMYKPPSWQVIEGARKLLPSAIVAMGTDDQTTLLIIGRGVLRGSLEAHVAANEKQLREIYENYRTIDESRGTVAGLPSVERKFRGTVDEHDWSGVVISFGRGSEVFTILGMTYADSDLIQIQENVIARAVASLTFLQ